MQRYGMRKMQSHVCIEFHRRINHSLLSTEYRTEQKYLLILRQLQGPTILCFTKDSVLPS